MKTAKKIYHQITSFENLLHACQKAARGKKERGYVLAFSRVLEDNLFELKHELDSCCYAPGEYRTFTIYEPKKRMISAAPFRDRIVHHALMNVVSPILEKGFIYDNYANRIGKGTHKAIHRYQEFARTFNYALKCDIKKYFPSIDHKLLKDSVRHRISDAKTLWLIDTIIDSSNEQELVLDYFPGDTLLSPIERRKGLPIGNLTSQWFANFYLDPLDHFVKEKLGCKGYLRYLDDFALFNDSKKRLWEWYGRISRFLENRRLTLNRSRFMLYPCVMPTSFLGQVICKSHRRLCGKNVRKFRKLLSKWQKEPPENIDQRIASWLGHAQQANTEGLQSRLMADIHNLTI